MGDACAMSRGHSRDHLGEERPSLVFGQHCLLHHALEELAALSDLHEDVIKSTLCYWIGTMGGKMYNIRMRNPLEGLVLDLELRR